MKKILLFAIIPMFMLHSCHQPKKRFNYPLTKKDTTTNDYFGTKVADPYRWLEDDRSEETAQWVKEENQLTFSYLESIPYREKLKNRLTEIWNYPRRSAPWKEGGMYFFSKNDGLQNQSVYYMQKSLDDNPELFLDPNNLSDDGTVALTNFSVSKDGRYLGYGTSTGGSDWKEFYVRDIPSGRDLDDHLQWIKFSGLSWFRDGFFYSRYPAPAPGDELKGQNKNSQVYYHKVGTAQEEDILVYEDPENPNWGFYASVTEDKKYLIISVTESTSGNALYYKDLESKNGKMIKIIESFDKDYTVIDHIDNELWVMTNDNAPNYRIIKIDTRHPERENWKDLIPEDEHNVLVNLSVTGGKVFANYQKDAHSMIKCFDLKGRFLHEVELPSLGTARGFSGDKEDAVTFYTFSSYTYPSVIYKYDIASNTSELYYQTKIDFDIDNYVTQQVFYTSNDGTRIPMFIVHKKGLELNGQNPTWLYGYGGFNISLNPGFDVRRLVWLENGGVFAVANIRGGGEYGEEWHQAGTKMKKQNVFDDFISAARYLVGEGYTSSDQLVIQGGSNGGLLVGAVVNQAPDLFRVAFPQVGVMDMLRYQNFTIGRYWATDYGTSQDTPEMFEYLYRYSPLHNIKSNLKYPSIMVTTADHDDRVVPAHSFKYIAALQEASTGERPAFIRIDIDAGHGAGKPTSKTIEEWADLYSFAFDQLGLQPDYQ